MRHMLRQIAANEINNLGDTLAEPSTVEHIIENRVN